MDPHGCSRPRNQMITQTHPRGNRRVLVFCYVISATEFGTHFHLLVQERKLYLIYLTVCSLRLILYISQFMTSSIGPDSKKGGGGMAPAPVLDLTTSL